MDLSTMADWLDYIASIHHTEMDLGLDRIRVVADRLGVLSFDCPIVTIGGTNGKGSTVAGVESIYRAANYNVGAFTSPIMFKHNEQVRLNGDNPPDDVFCHAFAKVEAARGEVTLTPFEFQTLAALHIFKSHSLDVLILEVGLGGRLDATNIVDADVAVVTSIGIDHTNFLGDTREKIGFEKAGIFRKGKPAVCGDPNPPGSLLVYAEEIGAKLYRQNEASSSAAHQNEKPRHCEERSDAAIQPQTLSHNQSTSPIEQLDCRVALRVPRNDESLIAPQNINNALAVIYLLQTKLPVSNQHITTGLKSVTLPGRLQVIPGEITEIHDVAHNPDAVQWLDSKLKNTPCLGKTIAVFSMLEDKDISSCVHRIKNQIDEWYIAPLNVKRGASLKQLAAILLKEKIKTVQQFTTIAEAYHAAKKTITKKDRLIVFGSFLTVAQSHCDR